MPWLHRGFSLTCLTDAVNCQSNKSWLPWFCKLFSLTRLTDIVNCETLLEKHETIFKYCGVILYFDILLFFYSLWHKCWENNIIKTCLSSVINVKVHIHHPTEFNSDVHILSICNYQSMKCTNNALCADTVIRSENA